MISFIKQSGKTISISVLGWTLAFYFYYCISYWALSESIKDNILSEYLSSWLAHFEIILAGFFFGLFFMLINKVTDQAIIRNRSIFTIIVVKSFLYLTAVIAVIYIIYGIYDYFGLMPKKIFDQLISFFKPQTIISMIVYMTIVLYLFNFIIILNRKLGKGNIVNLLFGKYHKPKVEDRIFMFLDLKDSTAIAEKLGHMKYSSMIRKCFHDLTDVLIRYKGEVYQYVGDEVVIMWNPSEGLTNFNCIKTYFEYEKKLKSLSDEYLSKFGFLPQFRAGMDMGQVTVVEIGDLKRDIAYHGDVLNTAARIQEQCKKLNKQILVSKNIIDKLNFNNGFENLSLGNFVLKGKKNSVEIFEIFKN